MTPPAQTDRQRSSIESFLDEYQLVRLFMNAAALMVVLVFVVAGWSQENSPIPSTVALTVTLGHAAWCRSRHIRAPIMMLLIDTTVTGAMMFTMTYDASLRTGIFAFMALIVVLFAQGPWMAGFLAYLTAWYLAAFVNASGFPIEPVGSLVASLAGSLLTVAALVGVMMRVRAWLGRLDAGRSQMIGTVSHELRNNLTGVLGLTEVVSTMEELEPAEARELIAMAHQQAIDANEIVEDLLTASRLEASALTMHAGLVDVNAEVVTIAGRFTGMTREIGLTLADDLPSAWADSLRVRQAIRNLVSNAIRYGGPVITIMTRDAGDAIHVTVRDNGDGVPHGEEANIFLPYRRSTVGRRDAASIGLGLWICRHIAQAMGGNLKYQRLDGFTEFVLSIPVATSDQDPAAAPIPAQVAGPRAGAEPSGMVRFVRAIPGH